MVPLESLTVGQVSAMIAAGAFAVQMFLPLAIPLVLLGFLRDRDHQITSTAVSWSVLNKALHSSWWPTILRSDSAATSSVQSSVFAAVNFGVGMSLLVSLAAIVTPLGLRDAVIPMSSTSAEPFTYVTDNSPLGYGTPPRSSLGFSRICGGDLYMPCPYSNFTAIYNENHTLVTVPDGYDTSVPSVLKDRYSSGLDLQNKSVSSIFDIQWRTYAVAQELETGDGGFFNNGSAYLVGNYKQLTSLLLDNTIAPVEGLIVDTTEAGVGFRNHSVPPSSLYGSTWDEDILFIEPETACVDTNLTIDFPLPSNPQERNYITYDIVLTDRGGFVNLDPEYEWWHLNNTQSNADLRGRAYKAAWLNNALTMMYLNITNPRLKAGRLEFVDSYVGKTYPLSGSSDDMLSNSSLANLTASVYPAIGAISASPYYGMYLRLAPGEDYLNSSTYQSDMYPNPNQITSDNFTLPSIMCSGVGGRDTANISNFGVGCGLLLPPPRPSKGNIDPFQIGTTGDMYSQPIYSCVTAAKASLKTVSFRYNGTGGLSGLNITALKQKAYSRPEDVPLWGVEDTGLDYVDILPLWGLVDREFEGNPNVSTLRKESLWLPGYTSYSFAPYDAIQNLPGVSFHMDAIASAYSIAVTDAHVMDYTGLTNFALYRKWVDLSGNARDVARIINLIWTDMVSNAVVGTRGWASLSESSRLRKRDTDSPVDTNLVPITLYARRVQYALAYAIPAIILLALTLGLCLLTIALLVLKRTGPSKMRTFLNRTSLGRNLTSLLYPEECTQDTPRGLWMKRDARKLVTLHPERPRLPVAVEIENEKPGLRADGGSMTKVTKIDQTQDVDTQNADSTRPSPA